MGMAASANLWYGVRGDVREAVVIELDEPADGGYEKIVDGVHITRIWCYDTPEGVGACLAHVYWGDRCEVDLARLPVIKAAADKFLDEWNVEGERGLYLTANYS